MRRSLGLLLGAALVLGACGLPEESLETEVTTTLPETTTSTVPDMTEADHPQNDLLARMIEQSIADLTERFGLSPTDVEVLEAEAVVWPDGSLGCPQPGMIYTQALVDGYRVLLGYQGGGFSYHAGPDAVPFYCESPSEAGGGDPTPPPVVMP